MADGPTKETPAGTRPGPRPRSALWLRGGIAAAAVLVVGAGSALAVAATGGHSRNARSHPLVSIPPVPPGASTTGPTATSTTLPAVTTTAPAHASSSAPTTGAPSPTPTTSGVMSGPVAVCGPGISPGTTPAGGAETTTAALDGVTATFSAVATGAAGGNPVAGPRLTIGDGGRTLLSTAVAPPAGVSNVMPWTLGTSSSPPFSQAQQITPLCIGLFPGQSFPTVLLGLTSGGAHCCTTLRAYQVGPSGVAAPVDLGLGDPTGTLTPSNGRALIATQDDAFAYRFTNFAASGMPLKAYVFEGGRFVDVTRPHLELVAADATSQWNAYQQSRSDPLGFLAAWAADESLLGRQAGALATIQQLQDSGELSDSPTGTKASTFTAGLRAFLASSGYG